MKIHFSNIIYFPITLNILIRLTILASSCSEAVKEKQVQEANASSKVHLIIKKPPSSFSDTVIINTKSAVFYNPDSLQLVKIKSVNEKNIFDMLTHDCHYQMQNAREVLRKYWPQVKIIETSKARYLLFVKADKSQIYIDLNKNNDICGLYLFDGKKDPVLADMPNIDTVLGFYFSK
jgi:hypothetical protein